MPVALLLEGCAHVAEVAFEGCYLPAVLVELLLQDRLRLGLLQLLLLVLQLVLLLVLQLVLLLLLLVLERCQLLLYCL